MTGRVALSLVIIALGVGLGADRALADDVWISDILANPPRYWNTEVTVTGQVQTAQPNPPGTTRGNYTLLDDSIQQTLTVRTKELPPVGQSFSVTGVIIQDPNQAGVPILNELSRRAPGMDPRLKALLIGGVALFAILLLIFVYMLMKPKPQPAPQATAYTPAPATPAAPAATVPAPAATVPAPAADNAKTRKIATGATSAPAAGGDKTQVFMNLGAELVVDRGPDKGRSVALHKPVTTIGRPGARKNDLELSDDTVSKEQAQLVYDQNTREFTVSNQSSTNPTLVNKSVVSGSVTLKDGDLLEMGGTVLRFQKT